MAEQTPSSGKRVTRSYRRPVGGAWWLWLLVVTVALGVVGRSDSGFWSVFLWSVVGFVVGSLVSIALSGRLVRASSEDEAFAGLVGADGVGGAR